jgi:DNA-binding XRE family transcriptional regulator
MTHHELKQTALKRPEVKAAYEALGPEFELLHQMVKARQEAGLTQAQVAERMGTKPPAVARLEASLSSGKHSPSLATLRKYAEAVACRLEIYLVRDQEAPNPRLVCPDKSSSADRCKSGRGHGQEATSQAPSASG